MYWMSPKLFFLSQKYKNNSDLNVHTSLERWSQYTLFKGKCQKHPEGEGSVQNLVGGTVHVHKNLVGGISLQTCSYWYSYNDTRELTA